MTLRYFLAVSFLLCLLSPLLMGQKTPFAPNVQYVWAPAGLNMRMEGAIHGNVVTKIPYGERVEMLGIGGMDMDLILAHEQVFTEDVRGDTYTLSGHWIKVKYEGQTGFVFDGYLGYLPPPQSGDDTFKLESIITYVERLFDLQLVDSIDLHREYPTIRKTFHGGAYIEAFSSTGGNSYQIIIPHLEVKNFVSLFLAKSEAVVNKDLQEVVYLVSVNDDCYEVQLSSSEDTSWKFSFRQFGPYLFVIMHYSC